LTFGGRYQPEAERQDSWPRLRAAVIRRLGSKASHERKGAQLA